MFGAISACIPRGSRGNPRLCLTPAATVPSYGDDPLLNGDMETGSPPSNWSALNGATLTSVADERTGGVGTKSIGIAKVASSFPGATQNFTTLVGSWWKLAVWAKNIDAVTGMVPQFKNGATVLMSCPIVSAADWALSSGIARATSVATTAAIVASSSGAAGTGGRADDVSVEPINLQSALSLAGDAGSKSGSWRCYPTGLVSPEVAGVVGCLDSISNPQNYLLGYVNLSTNKVWFIKCVAGTVAEATSGDITYVDKAPLEIVSQGSTHTLKYNNATVGTPQTVDTSSGFGTLVAGFDPQGGQRFDLVEAYV